MKIAVIGTGRVGGTLGVGWAAGDHEVIFGSRDPGSVKVKQLLVRAGERARATGIAAAAAAGDIVVLATPWPAAQETLKEIGDLKGKVLVDCTNPFAPDLKGLLVGGTSSAGEKVASWARGGRVVKAFNTTGSANMADPLYGTEKATMFVCGDDSQAKQVVSALAEELGFEACDTGPLYHARYLESLALLWADMARAEGRGPGFAFRMVTRS